MEINGVVFVPKSENIQEVVIDGEQQPYVIGKSYYIRTVTHHYVGMLKSIYKNELVLSNASWIADSGRWYNALQSGVLIEIEPYPSDVNVIIGRGAICDCSNWNHELPREQK
jgi:hypothetical protein